MMKPKKVTRVFATTYWTIGISLIILAGTAAWLQWAIPHQQLVDIPELTYQSLPSEPTDLELEQVTSELLHVDMYAVAYLEPNLENWLQRIGPRLVMEKLYRDADEGLTGVCHNAAHSIGNKAFALFGPAAFSAGNELCHSGYYHGVMEKFIEQEGVDNITQLLADMCDPLPTPFAQFQCYHGAGHGILGYLENGLPAALKKCKELAAAHQKQCFGGVFMENITVGIAKNETRHTTAWLNNDLHFPCNSVAQEADILDECYKMQTSWMLVLENGELAPVATVCTDAPPAYIGRCFESLGRDIAGRNHLNAESIKQQCDVAKKTGHYNNCIAGAVKATIAFYGTRLTNQPHLLCAALSVAHKESCYGTTIAYVTQLLPQLATASCKHTPAEYKRGCQ